MRLRLEKKALYLLLACALTPLLLTTLIFFKTFGLSLRNQVNKDFSQLGTQISHEIESFLSSSRNDLEFLSQTRIIKEQILEPWDKDGLLRRSLLEFIKYHSEFEEVLCIKYKSPTMEYFSSTNHLRVTQKVPMDYHRYLRSEDSSERPWLKSLDVKLSDLSKRPILPLIVNFVDEEDHHHILQGSVSLDWIFSKIKSFPLLGEPQSEQRMILIFDSNDELLHHPSKDLAVKSNWAGLLRDLKAQNFKSDYIFEGSTNYLYHYKTLPETGWQILFLVDDQSALSERLKLLKINLTILFVTLLVILWFSKYLAKKISAPLISLRQSAEAIEKSNFNIKLEIRTGDEIEELACSMQSMASSLSKYQKELEDSAIMLETRVQQRTGDYLRLIDDYKTLSSILTHDLGNYLNSLISLVEDLDETPKDIVAIDRIKKLSRDALIMFKKCSEYKNLQEGRLAFRPESITIDELFEDLDLLFSQRLRAKNLKLIFSDVEVVSVFVDREWFTLSVLANILGNAIKFSHNSGNVYVSCHELDDQVELVIKDEGIGISEKDISLLFNSSHRPYQLGTAGEKGTGFGLMIARKFLEQMGGTIQFESQLETTRNQGYTKVILRIPKEINENSIN